MRCSAPVAGVRCTWPGVCLRISPCDALAARACLFNDFPESWKTEVAGDMDPDSDGLHRVEVHEDRGGLGRPRFRIELVNVSEDHFEEPRYYELSDMVKAWTGMKPGIKWAAQISKELPPCLCFCLAKADADDHSQRLW